MTSKLGRRIFEGGFIPSFYIWGDRMRIFVKSNDKNLFEALELFAEESNEEYAKMRKGIRLRVIGLTGMVPQGLGMQAEKRDDGACLYTPIGIPDLSFIREMIKRYTGRQVSEARWKQRMIENVNKYLVAVNVSFDSIEFVGDEKDDDNSVQDNKKKDNEGPGQ